MSKDDKGKEGGANPSVDELKSQLDEMTKKHEDLNKGIAKYREDVKLSKKESDELRSMVAELQTKVGTNNDDGKKKDVEIHPDDAKVIEAYLKKMGVVTEQELEQKQKEEQKQTLKQVQDQAVTEFLEAHPEYDNDENWTKFQKEFSLYKNPTTLEGYQNLFKRVHKDLSGGTDNEAGDKVRADLSNKSRLSLGGGSQADGKKKGSDVDELSKKYPNLSRDQILSTLGELESLTEKEE